MSVFYRLLGMVAWLNERLGRVRVHFIPLNVIVMFTWVTGLTMFLALAPETFRNGQTPSPVNVVEVLQRRLPAGSYVTVSGQLHPELAISYFTYNYRSSSKKYHYHVPLVDPQLRRGLLVKVEPKPEGALGPHPATVTGMLRTTSIKLKNKILASRGPSAENPLGLNQIAAIDTDVMLVAGEKPLTWQWILIGICIIGFLTYSFGVTYLRKYVVFRRTDSDPLDSFLGQRPENAEEWDEDELRAAGAFVSDVGTVRRFVNLAVQWNMLDTGKIAFVSHPEPGGAAPMQGGKEVEGLWTILLEPGSLHDPDRGELYYGFWKRPALRLRAISVFTEKEATVILSFPTVAQRESFIRTFNQAIGKTIVPEY